MRKLFALLLMTTAAFAADASAWRVFLNPVIGQMLLPVTIPESDATEMVRVQARAVALATGVPRDVAELVYPGLFVAVRDDSSAATHYVLRYKIGDAERSVVEGRTVGGATFTIYGSQLKALTVTPVTVSGETVSLSQ